MTLNQLRYVVEVAQTGSINRAAANLFVSQSVLSTSISSLEKEIGHTIFARSNRGVTTTPFGLTFVSYVSSIQAQLSQLDHLISHGVQRQTFTLSITSTGYYFLSKVCADIYEKYRSMGIRIEEYENSITNIADTVANQSAEIGIVNFWSCYKNGFIRQLRAKGLQYYPVTALDVAVTVGRKNPLFHSGQTSVTPEDLKDYPLVTYTYMDSGPYSDIYSRLHLQDSGSRFVTSSRSTIYETLRNTDAYYLNSNYPFDLLEPDDPISYSNLRTLKLKDCHIRSELGWIKLENHTLSPLANEVISQIMRFFPNII